MFRITSFINGNEILLKVEGSLRGAGVHELNVCWSAAIECTTAEHIRVDLTDVCQIDDAGRALMTVMYRAGAQLMTKGFVLPEVVREIAQAAHTRRRS